MVCHLHANMVHMNVKAIKFNRVPWRRHPIKIAKCNLSHAKCHSAPNHPANWWAGNEIVLLLSIPTNLEFESCFQCAEQVGIAFDGIQECAYGTDGDKLQLAAERKTQDIAYPRQMLKFVPTIVYNRQFNQSKQNRSLQDFKGAVCDELRAISNHLPQICSI